MKLLFPLFVATLILLAPVSKLSADSGHWFYMVKSKPTDPAREDEYNAWYDDIDIPDVLAVPGFMRARRALGQRTPQMPETDLQEKEGKYVALYDIETEDIDKSIIDLYVAARKMSALGRLTDVLRVVEANYYQRLLPMFQVAEPDTADVNNIIYMQKVLCCSDGSKKQQFIDWYQTTLLTKIKNAKGFRRLNLYELYRIMEELAVGPEEIPHLLLVYEFREESVTDVINEITRTSDELTAAGQMNGLFIKGDATVYVGMREFISK